MKYFLLTISFLSVLLAFFTGHITVLNSEDLTTLNGGAEYLDGMVLKGAYCGHSSTPSGDNQCKMIMIPGYPRVTWNCEGECSDSWCVSTDIKYWCACSIPTSKCDTSDEHDCEGGTLYKSDNTCEREGLGCTSCDYYEAEEGC